MLIGVDRLHSRTPANMTMNDLVKSVKATGTIGCVGVFLLKDPGGPDELAQNGEIAFDFGSFWEKGQLIGTGQCNVKAYNRRLMRLIHNDKAQPSFLVSHDLDLDEAARAYAELDKRSDGWTKVILHPT